MTRLVRSLFALYPFSLGQGRIIDSTFLRNHSTGLTRATTRTRDGFAIDIMPDDLIGRHLRLTGQFDRAIPDILRSLASEGDRFLDIGANIGYVSCMMLHHIRGVRIVAVEPRPDCFAILQANLKRMSADAIAFNAAISSEDGQGFLRMASGNSGASKLVTHETGAAESAVPEIDVELLSGSTLLARSGIDRVDLVKIDVEGHEAAVLASLLPAVERRLPRAILFEHHGPFIGPSKTMLDSLVQRGYHLSCVRKSLFGWKLVPLKDPANGPFASDYVAKLKQ